MAATTPGQRAHDKWFEIMHGRAGSFKLLSPRAKLAWEAAAAAVLEESAKATESFAAVAALNVVQKENCASSKAPPNRR